MELEVCHDATELARRTADLIADEAAARIEAVGRFTLALSGGSTPRAMLGVLARSDLDWSTVHIFQVDERVAPDGHPDRNRTMLDEELLGRVEGATFHPMPVTASDGVSAYARTIEAICGLPPVIDVVHLGLGADGHTASLVPGDAVVDLTDRDVALVGAYDGRRRMTMTAPLINRARRRVWQVAGASKAEALRRLLSGEGSDPSIGIERTHTCVFADPEAAARA